MKKQTIGSLKKKAWTLFSRVVRQMYADHRGMVRCVTCGCERHWYNDGIDAGHFIPKSAGTAVYFECRNVHTQCKTCNSKHSGERVKPAYTLWMQDMYGRDEVERLMQLSRTQLKLTRADYLDLIEHFKQCEREL